MAGQKLPVSFIPAVLESDPTFVDNLSELKDLLNTPHGFWKPRYDNYRDTKITFYTLISELLAEWCGRVGANATIRELIGLLNQMGCRALAEKLKSKVFPMTLSTEITTISQELPRLPITDDPSSRISPFNIGPSLHRFVGRTKELQQLKQHYTDRRKEFAWKTVAVLGLGGIGKTQLVNRFLHDPIVFNSNITWFSGESPETLRESISSLAKTIEIENYQMVDTIQLLNRCGKELAKNRTWLIVIDNADDNYDLLKEVGIQLHSIHNTFVIVTSRLRRTFAQFAYQIDVKELDSQDSATLIKINIGSDHHDDEVEALSRTLQNFPLAIAQASAYIRETRACKDPNFGISDYIQEFERRSKELLSIQVDIDPYKKPTLVVWDMTIQAIRTHRNRGNSAMALRVLKLLAFLNPDKIEFTILENVYKASIPDFFPKFSTCSVQLLMEYSLVQISNGSIQLHRLVQEVTRLKLKDACDISNAKTFGQFHFDEYTEILNVAVDYLVDDCNLAEVFHLKHVWQIALHSETYPNSLDLHFFLPHFILVTLQNLELHRETYDYALLILTKVKSLGCKRIELAFQILLSHSLENLSEQLQAFRAINKVMEEGTQLFGPTDCLVLYATQFCFYLLKRNERYTKAQNLIVKTAQTCLENFGSDHEYTKLFQCYQVMSNDKVDEEDTRNLAEEIYYWGLHHVPQDLQSTDNNLTDMSINNNLNVGELDEIPEWIFRYATDKLSDDHVNMLQIEYNEVMNSVSTNL